MSDKKYEFTKDNLDQFLKDVGKEYRKAVGKNAPAELILIGGASVLINYSFRNTTSDIDAIIRADSAIHDAINRVRDKYGLPHGWLNDDFKNTASYTPKLLQYSKYYKTFSNVLAIRTIGAEYLIAMKLRSGRQYKNDISDIIGILADHQKEGSPITIERIKKAVKDLYGDINCLPEVSQKLLGAIAKRTDYINMYSQTLEDEINTRNMLLIFDTSYPGVTKESNIHQLIERMKEKANKNDK